MTTVPVPAGFSFRRMRSGSHYAAKLTRWEVAHIRAWCRTEGLGLPLVVQLDRVSQWHPEMSRDALRNVLTNGSWYDPTYQRDMALPTVTPPVPDPGYWWMGRLFLLVCLVTLASGRVR